MRKFRITSVKNLIFVFLFIVANSVFATSAHAGITFLYEGTVNYVDPVLSGTFSVGDTFSVQYTFNPLTSDSNASANRGDYQNTILSLSATIGSYSATASGSNRITVLDNNLSGSDDQYRIELIDPMSGPSVNGWNISTQTPVLQLRDTTETALSSDALPTTPPDPADFISGGTFLALEFVDPSCSFPDLCSAIVAADFLSAIVISEISCTGFDPPMDKIISVKKKNRVLPLKMVCYDGATELTDLDIAPPVVEVDYVDSNGTPGAVEEVLSAGQGDEGNQFVYSGGYWRFNLQTKNFSAYGTYAIKAMSGDTSSYNIEIPNPEATFVIE